MIQPFGCLCLLLAAGSGLYLYNAKHRTEVLDHQIADVLTQVDTARARTATLRAEYAALGEPDRLTALATRYLALAPTTPTQFVQLAALDDHLPPVQIFAKPGDPPAAPPTQANTTDSDANSGTDNIAGPSPADTPLALATPAVPAPTPAPRLLTTARPTRHAPLAPLAEPQYATSIHPTQMPLAAPRPVAAHILTTAALRPVAGQSRPRLTRTGYAPAYAAPAYPHRAEPGYASGSVLGGATADTLPPPVPIGN